VFSLASFLAFGDQACVASCVHQLLSALRLPGQTWPCSAAWGPRTSLDALSPPPRRPLTIPPQPRPQPRPRPYPAVISRFIALAWRAGYPTMTGLSRAPLRRALRVLPLGSRLFQLSEL